MSLQGTRLSLKECAARLVAQLADPTITVRTFMDKTYFTDFAKVFPAVWFVGQRMTPMDNGYGYSGQPRQTMKVEIAVRIIVKRFYTETVEVEDELSSLMNRVIDGLKDWAPNGAGRELTLESVTDGPPFEAVIVADLVFVTHVTFARG